MTTLLLPPAPRPLDPEREPFAVRDFEAMLTHRAGNDPTKLQLLQSSLNVAVPLYQAEIIAIGGITDTDIERAQRFGLRLASQADALLYQTEPGWQSLHDRKHPERRYRQWGTVELFNMMAEAVAIMSFFPCGVKLLGLHFEMEINWDAETNRP